MFIHETTHKKTEKTRQMIVSPTPIQVLPGSSGNLAEMSLQYGNTLDSSGEEICTLKAIYSM